MLKLKVMLVAVMFILTSAAVFADGLVVNENFNSGLGGWTTWAIKNSAGAPGVVDANGGTLNWTQTTAGQSGNAAGAYKLLGSVDVSGLASLVFKFDLNLQGQSLPAAGWAGGGEFPAVFTIGYNNANTYSHGFYLGNLAYAGAFSSQQIGTGWNTYTFDLKSLLINPSTINSINFYGNGWNYQASADNVLLGSADAVNAVPEPVSTTLFLLGGATLAVRRLRRK